MYSTCLDKLRIFLVLLAEYLEVMFWCKCELWCVRISLTCFKDLELGETIPNRIFTNGNNTEKMELKSFNLYCHIEEEEWKWTVKLCGKIKMRWVLWRNKKPRAKAIVCRSAFRRRHARLPALVGCILNFRRNWEYFHCCWYTIDILFWGVGGGEGGFCESLS